MNLVDRLVVDLQNAIATASDKEVRVVASAVIDCLGCTMKMVDDLEQRTGARKSLKLTMEMLAIVLQLSALRD